LACSSRPAATEILLDIAPFVKSRSLDVVLNKASTYQYKRKKIIFVAETKTANQKNNSIWIYKNKLLKIYLCQ